MAKLSAPQVLLQICAGAKPEEKILFVTDDTSKQIADVMWAASADYPNRSMVMMTDRRMHGDEPPATVAAAMANADVIFGCTKFSMFHTAARRNAVANGARFCNMADYSIEMMETGGLCADFIEQGKWMDRVSDVLPGKEVRITTALGTDLTCSIEGRKPVRQYGRSLVPGASSSPPDIETALGPIEGTMNGTLVVDGSIPCPGLGVLSETITIEIRDGNIVSFSGGEMAKRLEQTMKDFNDPDAYSVAEIGFGFNNCSVLSNRMLEDEGVMGTLHLGFGNSLSFGGSNGSNNHLDMVFCAPSVWVDGRQIMEAGEMLVK